ncbi:hypothetical protein COV18_06790 [Candidatus Woesearchaeota archaeon CG10_big_fil_rev_8_21_14_0_10_37_12]|nr:MAG: hypothetical protein COV18_06790 [Candidatus Woesearchaeota archaeon CG10_big_fil_rev_8_21_14_0_10_37_12]
MFKLLSDPVKEIKSVKRAGYAKIILYLLAAALFKTLGLFFVGLNLFPQYLVGSWLVPIVLFTFIIALPILAFFFAICMDILGGKGGYYEALATLTLSVVAPSIAMFFAGALLFIPYGSAVSALLLAAGYSIGVATFFRASKELFELNYTAILAACIALFFALFVVKALVFVVWFLH